MSKSTISTCRPWATPKHTPGPWKYHATDNPSVGSYGVTADGVTDLATIWPWAMRGEGADEANASLIAAAPELLWCLQRAWAIRANSWTKAEKDRSWTAWAHEANAAITKAEGREI